MINYLRLTLLSISFLAVSGVNSCAAIAADLSASRATSNPDLIAQSYVTRNDLEMQQWMLKGAKICGQAERQLRVNPNNIQVRQLYNSCVYMFKNQGLCQLTEAASLTPNFYKCNEELAEFAQQWE